MFTITIDGLEEVLRRVVQEELAAQRVGDEWLDSTEAAEYLGISRGHWEGSTLVVETRNFNDKTPATNFQGSTENLKMTERFTLVNPTTIKYVYTMDDPHTWTRPWSAEAFMPKIPPGIFEFACHESNYGVFNVVKGAQTREDELVKQGKPIGAAGGGGGAQ